jgi:hypothetical protein
VSKGRKGEGEESGSRSDSTLATRPPCLFTSSHLFPASLFTSSPILPPSSSFPPTYWSGSRLDLTLAARVSQNGVEQPREPSQPLRGEIRRRTGEGKFHPQKFT